MTYTVRFKLAELLTERGVSQRELSRMTGVRQAFISEMCAGKTRHLPVDNLVQICEALDVDLADIVEITKT